MMMVMKEVMLLNFSSIKIKINREHHGGHVHAEGDGFEKAPGQRARIKPAAAGA
jgi:hypothetical protein